MRNALGEAGGAATSGRFTESAVPPALTKPSSLPETK